MNSLDSAHGICQMPGGDRSGTALLNPHTCGQCSRGCYLDLQRMGGSQWGGDAILQLSTGWFGEVDQSNELT